MGPGGSDDEKMLADARDMLSRDSERALKLYSKIIKHGSGAGWACAHLEVAEHEYGLTRYTEAVYHARAILDAPHDHMLAKPRSRAATNMLP